MELFPNLKDTLLDLSYALDQQPQTVPASLVLGLDFASAAQKNQLDKLMTSLGFSRSNEFLWLRGDEIYENSFTQSQQGYVSLGELQEWRKSLLQRCKEVGAYLSLPSGTSLLAGDSELIKAALDRLCNETPQLKIVFNRADDPKEQAALFTALGFLSWVHTWRFLFEEMYFRDGLHNPEILTTLDLIQREHNAAEINEINAVLARRLGKNITSNLNNDLAIKALESLLKDFS